MARRDAPESWVGQQVTVYQWEGGEGNSQLSTTLTGVNDRGITTEFGEEFQFIPWHAVLQITTQKDRVPEKPKMRAVRKPPGA